MKNKAILIIALAALSGINDALATHAIDRKDTRRMNEGALDAYFQAGYLNGESREFVYYPGGLKMSELVWELNGLVTAGGGATYKMTEKIRANGGIWMALSEGSGSMLDYDWDIYENYWSQYSSSDADVLRALTMDANVCAEFFRSGEYDAEISFDAYAGLKISTYEWEAAGGQYVYSASPSTFRQYPGSFQEDEVVAEYEQLYILPYIGIAANYHSEEIDICIYCLGTVLGFAFDEDNHAAKGVTYKEDFTGVPYLGIGLSTTWRIGDKYFIVAGIEHEQIPETEGDMEIVSTGQTFSDNAGISHESTFFSVAFGKTY